MKRTLLTLAVTSLLVTTAFADPIHDAAKNNNLAGVQAELDKGVDVNKPDLGFFNLTPLHWVISKRVAELLISEGADVNALALDGSTPLHYAAWNGFTEIAELLIDNGADLNVINNELAGTPLITALDWAIQQGRTETADLLRKHGGMMVEELRSGMTPLHAAARKGLKEVVELLIAEGADVNEKIASGGSHKNKTPLDLAIQYEKPETADLLRTHGGKTSEELNVLIDAAKNGDIEAVKQHLAAGADVNAKSGDGTTPLHNAAIYGHNEIAELLIANGAEVNAIIVSGRNQGKTPVDLAIWRKKTATADLLRKHGGRTAEEIALMPRLVQHGRFAFSFDAKEGKVYEVQDSFDLLNWEVIKTYTGTGSSVRFDEERDHDPSQWFYRVRVVE
jgi:cytohesin